MQELLLHYAPEGQEEEEESVCKLLLTCPMRGKINDQVDRTRSSSWFVFDMDDKMLCSVVGYIP